MQHILYKITNLLNGHFYIGIHSTKNPDDGYLGSGRRIKAEIQKYGKENFKREILEVLPSRVDLKRRETEIVNEQLLSNPLCVNLKNGGEGNSSEDAKRMWQSEEYREKIRQARINTWKNEKFRLMISESLKRGFDNPETRKKLQENGRRTKGRKHSEETKAQLSQKAKNRSPEERARRSEGVRRWHERRKHAL